MSQVKPIGPLVNMLLTSVADVRKIQLRASLLQGRLNQWAHSARAQGPRVFFLFEGPPTGCGEINRPTVKGCSCSALG